MEGIYKKVYVKSAADLPKEDEVYYFGYYKENVVPFSVIYYDYDIRDVWLKSVDWYLQPVTAKTEQEKPKCNLCKDEHWIITHEGRVSEPCPACGGEKRYVEQEKPYESAEEFLTGKIGKLQNTEIDVNDYLLVEWLDEFASQKHPVTDDMISAKLDTVNFETSRERETAFDLLVWMRDKLNNKKI